MIVSRVYDAQRAAEMGGVLDIEKLIEDISAQNKPAHAITDVDEIVEKLSGELTFRRRRRDHVERRHSAGFMRSC